MLCIECSLQHNVGFKCRLVTVQLKEVHSHEYDVTDAL
jgi:hypothetical protein